MSNKDLCLASEIYVLIADCYWSQWWMLCGQTLQSFTQADATFRDFKGLMSFFPFIFFFFLSLWSQTFPLSLKMRTLKPTVHIGEIRKSPLMTRENHSSRNTWEGLLLVPQATLQKSRYSTTIKQTYILKKKKRKPWGRRWVLLNQAIAIVFQIQISSFEK